MIKIVETVVSTYFNQNVIHEASHGISPTPQRFDAAVEVSSLNAIRTSSNLSDFLIYM